jgi:hypothetical protein
VNEEILRLDGPLVFFPVRHHSPAAARLVTQLARARHPTAVLVEGPSDYNARLDELALPHELPIAIYSYVGSEDGARHGAFYPFCVYSPEWQALTVARELGVEARFIDLPWAAIASPTTPSHRYADGGLRHNPYVAALCQRLGVEDFDALWDTLFEIEPDLTVADYLARCHRLCYQMRVTDGAATEIDRRREAFMATQIRRTLDERGGPVLVVTGGFHSYALFARLTGVPFEDERGGGDGQDSAPLDAPASMSSDGEAGAPEVRGIALTPYTYERLDSLTGYDAGMPSPGFYHHVWTDRRAGRQETYRAILAEVATALRQRGQTASTADLIAVETMAQGLAALRGHRAVWRRDLVDAITSALIKEEIADDALHPFLAALYAVLRGHAHGRLADGTALPPLVEDIRRLLRDHDLEAQPRERTVELDLHAAEDLPRSRVLHRLRVLGIRGFTLVAGTDLTTRSDVSRIWEHWRIQWTPDVDASCIEAAIYGGSLIDAAAARLKERADALQRTAEGAALTLLDACLMGLGAQDVALFHGRLVALVRADRNAVTVMRALGHLLYLYRYDDALRVSGRPDVGLLLGEAFTRSLWLLEVLGDVGGIERDVLAGLHTLLAVFAAASATLGLSRDDLIATLRRVCGHGAGNPLLRGAAAGALWRLGEQDVEGVLAAMRYCADPGRLGDFLGGLFALARETVQRHPAVVRSIDDVIMSYGDDAYLAALPALRLAFSYFTPREKHYIARTLLEAHGGAAAEVVPALVVGPEVAARALAIEARLFRDIARYGLRREEP